MTNMEKYKEAFKEALEIDDSALTDELAFDSIPAIFLITQDVFIVYTSNIFAILGLRALYFLLEAIVHKFKYLQPALAIILIFIGLKIFIPWLFGVELEAWNSLAVTFTLLFAGIGFSIYKAKEN